MQSDFLRTCVHPSGRFVAGIHRPSYRVLNNRLSSAIMPLGVTDDRGVVRNHVNFPDGDLQIRAADPVYEVPNAFPMWGVTYILAGIAEKNGSDGLDFSFEPRGETTFRDVPGLEQVALEALPRPLLLTIAQTCTHAALLERLLPLCADFEYDSTGSPTGIRFKKVNGGTVVPCIRDHDLYETLGNNPFLPDELKRLMLLNPGVQGTSPVVGEYVDKERTHIWEYLRANSYIPWGHFAANMAQDSVRYSVKDLEIEDILGLRHLYYQRIYCNMALHLDLAPGRRGLLSVPELEEIRNSILERIKGGREPFFSATLWGWNYGYDFSPSGFRLHASHQQIHQQFALIPREAEAVTGMEGHGRFLSYAIGDNIAGFIRQYEKRHSTPFFKAYIRAVREGNRRLDGRADLPSELVICEDENAMLFVPKAQRSQGEIHIMTLKPVGNILEADRDMRHSLDRLILAAVKVLSGMGARMITCFEMSKRFTDDSDQRLMYCFLPRHPRSPGAFSEQQGRWITGHFPEDYAVCCRQALSAVELCSGPKNSGHP